MSQIPVKPGKRKSLVLNGIGQILLIVIGILTASYVEDWNKNRIDEKEFRSILEQIYTATFLDIQHSKLWVARANEQLKSINHLLTNPDALPDSKLTLSLFGVELYGISNQSEINKLLPFLDYHAEKYEDREMITQITGFTEGYFWHVLAGARDHKEIEEFLKDANIPSPNLTAGEAIDYSIWDRQDYEAVRHLIHSRELRSKLTSAKSKWEDILSALNVMAIEGKSTLDLIRTHYPELRLLFNNMGIIGGAVPTTGFVSSVPMKLIDPKKGIWEIDIELNDGVVKFRNQNSWKQNWGGQVFPNGEAEFDGYDIPVKAGKYHIILNLYDSKYEFVRQDN